MEDAAPSAMTGTIGAHPRGFGFVTRDDGAAHYVSPPQMRSLVPGDRVRFSLIAGPQGGQFSAVVHEVVERPETFWLGVLEPHGGALRLRPDEPCHASLLVEPAGPVAPHDVVQVRVAPQQDLGQPKVRATQVANLGPRDDRDFDVRYAIARWRLPVAFGEAALAQARGATEPTLAEAQALGFADLTALPFVTIDGEATQDFDDALCLSEDDGRRTLHVAIAHVSHYVPAGSALDAEARARATSVYLPDRTLPMLPPELSGGLCSLKPDRLRHALVCSLDYTADGAPMGYSFRPAVIRSAARLTYAQVAAGQEPAHVAPMVAALWRWFDTQGAARAARGLLEYRAEEPRLAVGADGTWAIEWVAPQRSNALVEEAMLAANRAAAAQLTLLGAGLLFRHQEGLDARRWEETRRWLCAHGIVAPEVPALADLRALLASGELPEPLRAQLAFRIRTAMSGAVYDEVQSSHFSLGFRTYTHFTSPIRRYADLLVHRLLLAQPVEVDPALADHLSESARAARQASRYPWERLKRRLVWKRGEREHDARVVSRNAKGMRVALARWEVAAWVAAGSLEARGWAWDEARGVWCRQRESLDVGSPVRVRLVSLHDEGPACELHAEAVS